MHGRNEVQTWVVVPPAPDELNGPITFVVNCNFNASVRGPCWGTFEWTLASGAKWQGSWTSPVMDLLTYESRMSMVGVGEGGAIDGRHLRFDGGSAPGEEYISGTIRIH
jgi:hypothetical protein